VKPPSTLLLLLSQPLGGAGNGGAEGCIFPPRAAARRPAPPLAARVAWAAVLLLAASAVPSSSAAAPLFRHVRIPVEETDGQRRVRVPATLAPGERLVIAVGTRPLVHWDSPADAETRGSWTAGAVGAGGSIASDGLDPSTAPRAIELRTFGPAPDEVDGWIIGAGVVSATLAEWPTGAALRSRIDAVGPGAGAAWVGAGSALGGAKGDPWIIWRDGAPHARLDIIVVFEGLSFGRVTPFGAQADISSGLACELWPGTAAHQTSRSYVTMVAGPGVWIGAPPGLGFAAGTRVEFRRRGRFVGSGTLDADRGSVWVARTGLAVASELVQAGDEALFQGIAGRDPGVTGQIIRADEDAVLVDVGEAAELAEGHVGVVWRDGREIGRLRVERAQPAYCRAARLGDWGAESPLVSDVVRFGPPSASKPIGQISGVHDGGVFEATLIDPDAPVHHPLAIQNGGEVVGVALLLCTEGEAGLGIALKESLSGTVAPGLTLVYEP